MENSNKVQQDQMSRAASIYQLKVVVLLEFNTIIRVTSEHTSAILCPEVIVKTARLQPVIELLLYSEHISTDICYCKEEVPITVKIIYAVIVPFCFRFTLVGIGCMCPFVTALSELMWYYCWHI